MGTFLSLSGIIGKSHSEVADCLAKYCQDNGGGLLQEELSVENKNCCIIKEEGNNTVVHYPSGYLERDQSSAFLSKELDAPVFSFHIHDGDLWMYLLFINGAIVDQFNPIPEYWEEEISEEEIASWSGNASIVTKHIPGLKPESIQKYLVRWLPEEESRKAYTTDEYMNEDWQLIDFMKKVGLTFPLDDQYQPTGSTYKLWTKDHKLIPVKAAPQRAVPLASTPVKRKWWEFWK